MSAPIGVRDFLAALPAHRGALHLSHNDHHSVYETVAQFLEHRAVEVGEFLSPEDQQEAMSSGELWCLQWYPTSPVGFFYAYGSTLANCLLAASR